MLPHTLEHTPNVFEFVNEVRQTIGNAQKQLPFLKYPMSLASSGDRLFGIFIMNIVPILA
jgi:hypothetical protein